MCLPLVNVNDFTLGLGLAIVVHRVSFSGLLWVKTQSHQLEKHRPLLK